MRRGAGIRALAALLLVLSGAAACASPPVGLMPPPRVPADKASESPKLDVMVAADGGLTVAGKATTLDRLPADLDAAFDAIGARGDRAGQTVMIVAEPTITYGTFMGLVGALRGAGWTRIGEIMVGAVR